MTTFANLITSYSQTDELTGSEFGTRDITINVPQAIQMDSNRRKAYRVSKIILSAKIPNIYSYGGLDNTTLKTSKDGGVTWDTVVIPMGSYTPQELNTTINAACGTNNYWTDNTQPGFIISYNPSTEYVYVTIDSTKLAVADQLEIDFSSSLIYKMLGFNLNACKFTTDGTFSAPNFAQFDTQGTYVDLYISAIQSTRLVNGRPNNALLRLPLQVATGQNEIIFPSTNTGTVSAYINATISSYISNYKVTFVNGRGNPLVLSYGQSYTETELIDI